VNSSALSLVASAAEELGVPGAHRVALYLDPPTFTDWVSDKGRTLFSHRSKLVNYRSQLEDLVLAVAGHEECPQLVACTAAKYATRLPGSGALSYLLGSQAGGLPQGFRELVDVFRYSVMLGDDCSQYRCRDDLGKQGQQLLQPR